MCDCVQARTCGLGLPLHGEDALAGEEGEGKWGVSEEGGTGRRGGGKGVGFTLVLV